MFVEKKPIVERKHLILQDVGVVRDGTGSVTGYAAIFDVIDDVGDSIQNGAFTNLEAFLRDGWLTVNHDWDSLPIGTITEAVQDEKGLRVKLEFHDTEAAQAVRKVVLERLARGKSVRFSIGYVATKATVGADGVRVLEEVELYEISVVNVPANPLATAVEAKSKTLADEGADALKAVAEFKDRLAAIAELRAPRKPLSEKAAPIVSELITGLNDLLGQLESLTDKAEEVTEEEALSEVEEVAVEVVAVEDELAEEDLIDVGEMIAEFAKEGFDETVDEIEVIGAYAEHILEEIENDFE